MAISKLLAIHEQESLYSGANSAIWYSHKLAADSARRKAREEDFVATLVTDGIPVLAERWAPLLNSKKIGLKISGVFCHGHPQVAFGTSGAQVELADLLVVHQHVGRTRATARAMLLQAKMSADSTHALTANDDQLALFSTWPKFNFVTGGLTVGERDLKEKGRGSRYALVLDRPAYPEEITWADQCPWGASRAVKNLCVDGSLARLLGNMLLGKDGRSFQLGKPRDDWSRTIQELLEITGKRTYKRANIERGDTPRLTSSSIAKTGLMLFSTHGLAGAANQSSATTSLSERYFGSAYLEDYVSGGDGGADLTNKGNLRVPEGGMSSLIIETSESIG